MRTELCDELGIEFPIFAFTHCRDVVAAVSNAGGFGVLGAVGFSPEQLQTELEWIDDHVGDNPYGVDIVIPGAYDGMGEMDAEKLEADLEALIPAGTRDFARQLYTDAGVPELPADKEPPSLLGWTLATATPQVEIALEHPQVKLIANALGTPPSQVVDMVHAEGRMIAALCGSGAQAQHHVDGGIDIIIAQGTEGGGHTGEIGSMVLWPEVIEVAGDTPVLAAGGIGTGRQLAAALALGAQGVWTGSLWLTVTEADTPPAQMQAYFDADTRSTVRSRSWTGKPCRMLRNEWTEAWERDDTPDTLGMPMQFMVTGEMVARHAQYAEKAQPVGFNPVGQIVGRMNKARRTKDVIYEMVEEAIESTERLNTLMDNAG